MKRPILCLLFAIMLVLLLPCGCAAVSETDDGVLYRVEEDHVVVVGWNAAGSVMHVPDTIEGLPVRAVANQACRGDTTLTEVHLPASVITIGDYAFAECTNLLRVTFDGVEVIGFSAFRDCHALLSVTLPETLLTLEDDAFHGCIMLRSLTIPSSLVTIGYDVFNGCDKLILDVSQNPAAQAYAKQYAIPTSFAETWEFTLIWIAAATVILGTGVFLVKKFIKKK